MSACFIFVGKSPSSSDLLNIISSGTAIWLAKDFSSRLLMLSYPLLPLFGNFFIRVRISVIDVGLRNMLASYWCRPLR